MSQMRGIRGATTVPTPAAAAVREATEELLDTLARTNGCVTEDVAAAIFTLTPDLGNAAPAAVARRHGWEAVPLLQVVEHGGAGSIPMCIRVLVLWNTDLPQSEIKHIYLREAVVLRPDVVEAGGRL